MSSGKSGTSPGRPGVKYSRGKNLTDRKGPPAAPAHRTQHLTPPLSQGRMQLSFLHPKSISLVPEAECSVAGQDLPETTVSSVSYQACWRYLTEKDAFPDGERQFSHLSWYMRPTQKTGIRITGLLSHQPFGKGIQRRMPFQTREVSHDFRSTPKPP